MTAIRCDLAVVDIRFADVESVLLKDCVELSNTVRFSFEEFGHAPRKFIRKFIIRFSWRYIIHVIRQLAKKWMEKRNRCHILRFGAVTFNLLFQKRLIRLQPIQFRSHAGSYILEPFYASLFFLIE